MAGDALRLCFALAGAAALRITRIPDIMEIPGSRQNYRSAEVPEFRKFRVPAEFRFRSNEQPNW
jgi:hypothetical protein